MLISIVCLTNHHIVVYGQEEEEQDGCTRLAKDLQCSACSIFIDEYFKTEYYPLDSLNKHTFIPFYTIIDHEIWKMIDPHNETIQGDKVEGTARVNPLSPNSNTDYVKNSKI